MTSRTIDLGCVLPHGPLAAEPSRAAEYFRAVEDIGFDYVVGFDHVAGAPREELSGLAFAPYTHSSPFMELLVTLAHGAAVTTRLGLAAGVLVLPQRQTVLAAKQLATLSSLSGGRLVVGIGVGWNPAEFASLGVEFARRGARLDEQVPLLRRLWTEETVVANDRQHGWGPIGIAPRPEHPIPLWFGGAGEAAVRRVVAWGEGFVPSRADARTGAPPDNVALIARMHRVCEEAGRDPDTVGVEGRADHCSDDGFRRAVSKWAQLGATRVAVTLPPAEAPDLDAHIDRLAHSLELMRGVLGRTAGTSHTELSISGLEQT